MNTVDIVIGYCDTRTLHHMLIIIGIISSDLKDFKINKSQGLPAKLTCPNLKIFLNC